MLDELGYQWRAARARASWARSTEVLWSDSAERERHRRRRRCGDHALGRDAIHAKHGGYEDRIEVAHTNPHVRRAPRKLQKAAPQYAEAS